MKTNRFKFFDPSDGSSEPEKMGSPTSNKEDENAESGQRDALVKSIVLSVSPDVRATVASSLFSGVEFRSDSTTEKRNKALDEMKASLAGIREDHELKQPMMLVGSAIETVVESMKRLETKVDQGFLAVDSGFQTIHDKMDVFDNRLSTLVGRDKADNDIAVIVEKGAKRWLEKHYKRSFQRSVELVLKNGNTQEIDLYSKPTKADEPHIIAECTIALRSFAKVLLCVGKRLDLKKSLEAEPGSKEVVAYIFAMRIDAESEQEICAELEKHGILLRLCPTLPEESAPLHDDTQPRPRTRIKL